MGSVDYYGCYGIWWDRCSVFGASIIILGGLILYGVIEKRQTIVEHKQNVIMNNLPPEWKSLYKEIKPSDGLSVEKFFNIYEKSNHFEGWPILGLSQVDFIADRYFFTGQQKEIRFILLHKCKDSLLSGLETTE